MSKQKNNEPDKTKSDSRENASAAKEPKIEKKKSRFNMLDLSVVLIIFIVSGLLIMKFYNRKLQNLNNNHDFYFTIEALNLDSDFVSKNKISVGNKICDSVRGFYYGKISKIKSKPTKRVSEDNINGCYVLANIPDKVDLEVTVKCRASFSDDAIKVDGHPVRIGKIMALKSKGYILYGHIIDMQAEGQI